VDTLPAQPHQFLSTLSPDGRWLAYNSTSTGKWDVYLERFPADGRRHKVSPAGGVEPLWSDARHLVYRSGSTWYEVRVDPAGQRPTSEPKALFSDPRFLDTRGRSNVMAPDGSIIYLRGTAQTTRTFLRVIPGFTDLLRRRVKEARQ
jgi:serine/threonine-protein kinase